MRGRSASGARAGMRRRVLAAMIALACVWALLVPRPAATDAAFTDAEYAASGTVTAATLSTPTITSCTVQTLLNLGIVFTGFTIVWTSPYDSAGVRLSINGVVVGASNISQSGTGPFTYTAVLSYNVLSTLLGSLLGSSNAVTVEAVAGSSWASPAATRTLKVGGVGGLLGGNTCTAP